MKYSYPISIIDDFLDNPEAVSKWGISIPKDYHPMRIYPGKRSQNLTEIYPEFANLIFKKILSVFYENPPFQYSGGLFFDVIEKNLYEEGWVHQDPTDISFVIYLNKEYKNNCGTSIYKPTPNNISIPSNTRQLTDLKSKDFFNKKITEEGRKARNIYNSNYENVLNINPLFNRCLIFPGSHPHSVNSVDTGTEEDRFIIMGYISKLVSPSPPLNRPVVL